MEGSDITEQIQEDYAQNSSQIQFCSISDKHFIIQFDQNYHKYLNNYNDNEISISRLVQFDEFAENNHSLTREILKKIREFCPNLEFHRRISGDGNCFYRAFIYQYFENLLFYRKTSGYLESASLFLKIMFNKIFQERVDHIKHFAEYFEAFHHCKLLYAKTVCLAVFKYMISILSTDNSKLSNPSEKIKTAHGIFFLNFSFNKIFDNYLICWFRTYLYNFLRDKGDEEITLGTKTYNYCGNSPCLENYKPYLKRNILTFGEEGEMLAIYMTSFLFRTKFTTVAVKNGNVYKMDYGYDNVNLVAPDSEIQTCLPELNFFLFHTGNHYDAIYDDSIYIYLDDIIPWDFGEQPGIPLINLKKELDCKQIKEGDFQCKDCKLWFSRAKGNDNPLIIPFCLVNCIQEYLDRVMCIDCYYQYFTRQITILLEQMKGRQHLYHKCFPYYIMAGNIVDGKYPLVIPKCYNCEKFGCITEEMLLKKNLWKLKRKLKNYKEPILSLIVSQGISSHIADNPSKSGTLSKQKVQEPGGNFIDGISKDNLNKLANKGNSAVIQEKPLNLKSTYFDQTPKNANEAFETHSPGDNVSIEETYLDVKNIKDLTSTIMPESKPLVIHAQEAKKETQVDEKNFQGEGMQIEENQSEKENEPLQEKNSTEATKHWSYTAIQDQVNNQNANENLYPIKAEITQYNRVCEKIILEEEKKGDDNQSKNEKNSLQEIASIEVTNNNHNYWKDAPIQDQVNKQDPNQNLWSTKTEAKQYNEMKESEMKPISLNASQISKASICETQCKHKSLYKKYICSHKGYCRECENNHEFFIQNHLLNPNLFSCSLCTMGFSIFMTKEFNEMLDLSQNPYFRRLNLISTNYCSILKYGQASLEKLNGKWSFRCEKCREALSSCTCSDVCPACKLRLNKDVNENSDLLICDTCMIQHCNKCQSFQDYNQSNEVQLCKCDSSQNTNKFKKKIFCVKCFQLQTFSLQILKDRRIIHCTVCSD